MSTTIKGEVNIANDVLADMAGYAALECYGVVGMANQTLRDGVEQILSRERLRRGVRIANSESEDGIQVDLYVVMEHGTNLAEVSHNLRDRVRYVLTTMADVKIAAIEVHVQDLKVRT